MKMDKDFFCLDAKAFLYQGSEHACLQCGFLQVPHRNPLQPQTGGSGSFTSSDKGVTLVETPQLPLGI